MFNLESSISTWRNQMLAAGIQSPVPLVELEAHLRDHIEQLVKSGRTEQAAFEIAAQRIGNTSALKTEFAKVHGSPAARKPITVFAPLFVSFFSLAMMTPAILRAGNFGELTPCQQISCLAAAAATAFFCWAGVLAHRYFPVIRGKRTRDTAYISAGTLLVLWWLVFFFVILPGSEFTIAQLLVAICWSFAAPYGILSGLMAGLEKAATRSTLPENS